MLKGLRKNNQYSLYIPQVVDEMMGGTKILINHSPSFGRYQQYDWINLTIPQQRPKQSTVFWRKDFSSNPQLVPASQLSRPQLHGHIIAQRFLEVHARRRPRPTGRGTTHLGMTKRRFLVSVGQKVGWFPWENI
jgi:hypothetical protein